MIVFENEDLISVEKAVGIEFTDKGLLAKALIHSSYRAENNIDYDNERLEFLGDSVLGLAISDWLFRTYPNETEGYLAKIKGVAVSKNILACISIKLGLPQVVKLSIGEEKSDARNRYSLAEDLLEAIIGAYYLDAGFEAASLFVQTVFAEELPDIIENIIEYSYRTEFQKIVQRHFKISPTFKTTKVEGLDNDLTFTVAVYIEDEFYGEGVGKSKKAAGAIAAKVGFKRLGKELYEKRDKNGK